MKLTFLGTGTSQGVPVIGCNCQVCKSPNIKDKRTRTSVWLHDDSTSILIDSGPDFREQALKANIQYLDAILITHNHRDHVAGLDDIRPFNARQKSAIDLFIKDSEYDGFKKSFHYIFDPNTQKGGGLPGICINQIKENKPVVIKGISFMPLTVFHGEKSIYGFKFGDTVYITDAKTIPKNSLKQIKGVKNLVINTLRFKQHSTHLNLAETLNIVEKTAAEQVYLVHLTHNMDHEILSDILPSYIRPAYDCLEIEVNI